MRIFIDAATGDPWYFEDSFIITQENSIYVVTAPEGRRIDTPETLEPAPEDWTPPEPPPLTIQDIQAQRLSAYRSESDPLKIEAEYDAYIANVDPDYERWRQAVKAIKARYPLPAA